MCTSSSVANKSVEIINYDLDYQHDINLFISLHFKGCVNDEFIFIGEIRPKFSNDGKTFALIYNSSNPKRDCFSYVMLGSNITNLECDYLVATTFRKHNKKILCIHNQNKNQNQMFAMDIFLYDVDNRVLISKVPINGVYDPHFKRSLAFVGKYLVLIKNSFSEKLIVLTWIESDFWQIEKITNIDVTNSNVNCIRLLEVHDYLLSMIVVHQIKETISNNTCFLANFYYY